MSQIPWIRKVKQTGNTQQETVSRLKYKIAGRASHRAANFTQIEEKDEIYLQPA